MKDLPRRNAGDPSLAPAHQHGLKLDVLHDKELADMREVIAQLLVQLDHLQQRCDAAQKRESKEAQLREANEHLVLATFGAQDLQASAEASMQRQMNFLSMLAHELRNPLQPIASANTLLSKLPGDSAERPRLQAIIDRQIGHMTRLIDDLLDASRIGTGKIGLESSLLSLADILDTAVEASQPLIDGRHQRLRIVPPAAPVTVHGDRVRLVQVFSNLLNNASKFSPDNEVIELRTELAGKIVQVSVSDHGMGIADELRPFIFDLFTQGVQSLDRAQGGLGIGLTMVRALVEMHGGTVRVHSDGIGLGSIFTVLLPLSAAPAQAQPSVMPPAPGTRPLRILLIEDNVDAAEALGMLLEQSGHAVRQCHNGAGAVALALAQPYDLVLCDIGLPGLDGFAVVERIRAAMPGKLPLFIATSGYNQPHDRARASRSGFDHYLVKPVAIEILLALIELHLR